MHINTSLSNVRAHCAYYRLYHAMSHLRIYYVPMFLDLTYGLVLYSYSIYTLLTLVGGLLRFISLDSPF
jgi:hypothetical protein